MTKPAYYFVPRWPEDLSVSYGPYKAVLDRWIDADTGVFLTDLGFARYEYVTIRLSGYDAPEPNTAAGRAATGFAGELAPPGSRVRLWSEKDGRYHPTFTRWSAHIELEHGLDYGRMLHDSGHATRRP
jgi:endonuclease YncB( thermonuclease family)